MSSLFIKIRVSSSFRTPSSNTHWVLVSSIFRVQNRVCRQVYQVLPRIFWVLQVLLSSSLAKTQTIELKFDCVWNLSAKTRVFEFCVAHSSTIAYNLENIFQNTKIIIAIWLMKDRQTFEELDLWYIHDLNLFFYVQMSFLIISTDKL